MSYTKDNKGITLTVLVITIIVLSIIAGTLTYSGINSINKSRDQVLLAELDEVKHMVGESFIIYNKTKNANYLVGEILSPSEVTTLQQTLGVTFINNISDTYTENEKAYRRLTPSDLLKIGVEDSEDTYVVNYVTGETINETQLETSEGEKLYTYIRSIFNNNDVTAF